LQYSKPATLTLPAPGPWPFVEPRREALALQMTMYSRVVGATLDAQQLRQMYEQYGPLVYRRALRILGNAHDAEEALHEVFLRVMRGAETFEHRSQVTTWLYRITTNYCLNYLRDHQRRRQLLEENLREPEERQASDGDRIHDLTLLRHLVAEADESQAQAAIYVYVDGMSHDEAAQVLGVSRRTVGNLLERFGKAMRERAAAPDEDP